MSPFIGSFILAVTSLFLWSGTLLAQYTLVLKNGRSITVEAYREEGGMIKFYGFGGEVGIAKEHIQTIAKASGPEGLGMVVGRERPPGAPPGAGPAPVSEAKAEEKAAEAKGKGLTPEEQLKAEKEKEEKEYQQRVKEITERLKAARDRYALSTRGSAGPEPSVPITEEQLRARQADLLSRFRDVQHDPSAPRTTVETPPAGYSEKEKELSDQRAQIGQLESERERLIQEMRQKGFDTGGLFLD